MGRVEMNQKAPAFEVEDYLGQRVALQDYLRSYNVLLVFNRGFV